MTTPEPPAPGSPRPPRRRQEGPRPRRSRPARRDHLGASCWSRRSCCRCSSGRPPSWPSSRSPWWWRSGSCTGDCRAKGIDIPEQPLMLGGVVMVVVAYFWGAPAAGHRDRGHRARRSCSGCCAAASTATSRTRRPRSSRWSTSRSSARSWRCCSPRAGQPRRSASTLDDHGVRGVITFIAITVASDTGGYIAGVLFGKHPMARVISPEEVVGGLRRLAGRVRRRGRLAGHLPSSAATGGSACSSA